MGEVDGLVGRRAVGGLGQVGASQQKLERSGVGQKKSDKKTVPRKEKTELGKKI